MKECTLEQAIKLCSKNGGYFYRNSGSTEALTIIDDYKIVTRDTKVRMYLDVPDFKITWIYCPKQKSAFQEWSGCQPKYYLHDNRDDIFRGRREGWNGFANILSEWIEKEGMPAEVNPVGILQKIKEMREP